MTETSAALVSAAIFALAYARAVTINHRLRARLWEARLEAAMGPFPAPPDWVTPDPLPRLELRTLEWAPPSEWTP